MSVCLCVCVSTKNTKNESTCRRNSEQKLQQFQTDLLYLSVPARGRAEEIDTHKHTTHTHTHKRAVTQTPCQIQSQGLDIFAPLTSEGVGKYFVRLYSLLD